MAAAVLDSRFGLNQGFDFYYDHFDFSRLLETNLDEMERPGNLVANQVLEWLGQNSQKKFFLWMHLYDPHFPYRPPAPYSEQYRNQLYDGEIAFADEQVGRLLQFLKQKNLYQYTMIVWAIALGYLVFGDVPDALTLSGSAIIVAAGLYIFWREQVVARRDPDFMAPP